MSLPTGRQEGAELMAIFRRMQAPLARLLPEAGGAGALTADHRVLQILNADYVAWTEIWPITRIT